MGELREIASTTDAMVEACKQKSAVGREAFGNRGPNKIDTTNTNTSNIIKYYYECCY